MRPRCCRHLYACVLLGDILVGFEGWTYIKLSVHFSVSRTGWNFGCPSDKFRKRNPAVSAAHERNYTLTWVKNFKQTRAFVLTQHRLLIFHWLPSFSSMPLWTQVSDVINQYYLGGLETYYLKGWVVLCVSSNIVVVTYIRQRSILKGKPLPFIQTDKSVACPCVSVCPSNHADVLHSCCMLPKYV